jgi:hypothetical protein
LTADATFLCLLAKKATEELLEFTNFTRLKNLLLWLYAKLGLGFMSRTDTRRTTINPSFIAMLAQVLSV